MGRNIKAIYSCPCGETNKDNFYASSKSKCRVCESKRARDRYRTFSSSEKSLYIKNQTKWASDNIIKVRVLAAKHRARRKKIDFDIDEDFINELLLKQNHRCYYSGVLLDITSIGSDVTQMNSNTLSIDRKDSKIGYLKSNVVLVTAVVNVMKADLADDVFINTINLICEHNKVLKNI